MDTVDGNLRSPGLATPQVDRRKAIDAMNNVSNALNSSAIKPTENYYANSYTNNFVQSQALTLQQAHSWYVSMANYIPYSMKNSEIINLLKQYANNNVAVFNDIQSWSNGIVHYFTKINKPHTQSEVDEYNHAKNVSSAAAKVSREVSAKTNKNYREYNSKIMTNYLNASGSDIVSILHSIRDSYAYDIMLYNTATKYNDVKNRQIILNRLNEYDRRWTELESIINNHIASNDTKYVADFLTAYRNNPLEQLSNDDKQYIDMWLYNNGFIQAQDMQVFRNSQIRGVVSNATKK